MDFVAIVDQVITLLRQRGRMTYRTLQRQFQLDDDALHDRTDELLYTYPEVRDDAGRGLVWTGDIETPVSPASPASLQAPPPAAASSPEAERRQLTILLALAEMCGRPLASTAVCPCRLLGWWQRRRQERERNGKLFF